MEKKLTNEQLEQAMNAASLGEEKDVRAFYHLLVTCKLAVPHRFQAHPLTNSPAYPNNFINILGVQDVNRVVVPVFTDEALLDEWCGNSFTYDVVEVAKLLERIPKEWWIIINPGQSVEKELSPWEIDLLRGGEKFIPEMTEALSDQLFQAPIVLYPITADSKMELKNSLKEFGEKNEKILKLYIAKVTPDKNEDASQNAILFAPLLIGVITRDQDIRQRKILRQALHDHIATSFIGQEEPKIFISDITLEKSPFIGLFENIEPIFSRPYEEHFKISKIFKSRKH